MIAAAAAASVLVIDPRSVAFAGLAAPVGASSFVVVETGVDLGVDTVERVAALALFDSRRPDFVVARYRQGAETALDCEWIGVSPTDVVERIDLAVAPLVASGSYNKKL